MSGGPSPRTTPAPHAPLLQDARRAFKALAYKRYQHVPLYLEWAPKGIFSSPPPPRPTGTSAAAAAAQPSAVAATAPAAPAKGKAGKAKPGAAAPEAELLTGLAEAQAEEAESSSIFVKNLAWATGEAALRTHFDAAVSAAGGCGVWMGVWEAAWVARAWLQWGHGALPALGVRMARCGAVQAGA